MTELAFSRLDRSTFIKWRQCNGTSILSFRDEVSLPAKEHWKTTSEGMTIVWHLPIELHGEGNQLRDTSGILDDFPCLSYCNNIWTDTGDSEFYRSTKFMLCKPLPKLLNVACLMTTDPGDLVLDPTCGSGTTAYVAEQWGRRWITIDTSRVAIALARTRLMAARYPYYLLADSPEGVHKGSRAQRAATALQPLPRGPAATSTRASSTSACRTSRSSPSPTTRRSTPSTPSGRTQLEPLRARLNHAAEADLGGVGDPARGGSPAGPAEAAEAARPSGGSCAASGRRRSTPPSPGAPIPSCSTTSPTRTTSASASTGPFTVESLSPHRVLSTDEERPAIGGRRPAAAPAPGQFETMILDNLRNGRRAEHGQEASA